MLPEQLTWMFLMCFLAKLSSLGQKNLYPLSWNTPAWLSFTAYCQESNCHHLKQMRNVLQLCGRGSNLQHWALYKEVMTASHLNGNSLYVASNLSLKRLWNRDRSSEIPQTIPCTLDKLQATGIASCMLSCSCVQRVCKMAGVYLCSFIGPYKVQGNRETHIQCGWLLVCLSNFYMSNLVSWATVPDFTSLFVKQVGSWAV